MSLGGSMWTIYQKQRWKVIGGPRVHGSETVNYTDLLGLMVMMTDSDHNKDDDSVRQELWNVSLWKANNLLKFIDGK